jgi:hypothetical protein
MFSNGIIVSVISMYLKYLEPLKFNPTEIFSVIFRDLSTSMVKYFKIW